MEDVARLKRRACRALVGCAVVLAISVFALSSCVEFVPSERSLAKSFAGRERPLLATIESGGRTLRYAAIGDPALPHVLLVHGSPGSWTDFVALLRDPDLVARLRLLAPDRPGFGGSSEGGVVASVARQAELLRPLFDLDPERRPLILLGHSYGGPIAARLAMEHPERVSGLILVAASIDPALEEVAWFQRLARTRAVRALLPAPLARSDDEMRPLAADLEAMLPRWREVALPVTVIQGEKDRLVPAANADFAARMLTSAQLTMSRVGDAGHLIPWQRPGLIKQALLAHLAQDYRPR